MKITSIIHVTDRRDWRRHWTRRQSTIMSKAKPFNFKYFKQNKVNNVRRRDNRGRRRMYARTSVPRREILIGWWRGKRGAHTWAIVIVITRWVRRHLPLLSDIVGLETCRQRQYTRWLEEYDSTHGYGVRCA